MKKRQPRKNIRSVSFPNTGGQLRFHFCLDYGVIVCPVALLLCLGKQASEGSVISVAVRHLQLSAISQSNFLRRLIQI